MAISVAKQYCPDFNSLIDPLRTLQSFDYFGHTDQMEFTVSTDSDEVSTYTILFSLNWFHFYELYAHIHQGVLLSSYLKGEKVDEIEELRRF